MNDDDGEDNKWYTYAYTHIQKEREKEMAKFIENKIWINKQQRHCQCKIQLNYDDDDDECMYWKNEQSSSSSLNLINRTNKRKTIEWND